MEIDKVDGIVKKLKKQKEELDSLLEKAKLLLEEIERGELPQSEPPILEEGIYGAKNYLVRLEKWLRKPHVEKISQLVTMLKDLSGDEREFYIDENYDYYRSNLHVLDEVVKQIQRIPYEDLRKRIAEIALNELKKYESYGEASRAQESLSSLKEATINLLLCIDEVQKIDDTAGFFSCVKNALLRELRDRIDPRDINVEKVREILRMTREIRDRAVNLGISQATLIRSFKRLNGLCSNRLQQIVNTLNYIIELLQETEIDLDLEREKVYEPFAQAKEIMEKRRRCLEKAPTLHGIYECLRSIREYDLRQFRDHLKRCVREDLNRVQRLSSAAGLLHEFRGIKNRIESIMQIDSFDIAELYEIYGELIEFYDNVRSKLSEKLRYQGPELKLLENLELSQIIEEFGEDAAWKALRRLWKDGAIKIKIEV